MQLFMQNYAATTDSKLTLVPKSVTEPVPFLSQEQLARAYRRNEGLGARKIRRKLLEIFPESEVRE